MVEYTTLRVPQDAADAARESKKDGETWGDYLLRCADSDVPQRWTEQEIKDLVDRRLESAMSEMRH